MRTLNLLKVIAFLLITAFGTASQAATVNGTATMDAFGSPTPVAAEGAVVRVCLTMVGAPLTCFMPLQSVTVGADGNYSLTSNVGTYVLQAIYQGGALLFAQSIEFTETEQVITQDIFLEPLKYDITGQVTGAGEPVTGATVRLYYAGKTTVLASATTDASGNYSLSQVPNGDYDLKASPPTGLLYTTESASLTISNASTAHDFALVPNFSVAGTVTAGGLALAGAEVSLYAPGEGSATGDTPVASGFTNTVGNYSLPMVPAGTYELEVDPPAGSAYALRRVTDVAVSGDGDVQDVALYQVTGQVTNADTGEVLAGVELRVCDSNGCGTSILATLFTDAGGNYVLQNPPDGSWLLSILLDDFFGYEGTLSTDGTDQVKDISVAPFKGFTGTVYAGGAPLANATVNLTLAGSLTLEDSVTTDANGVYRLWSPPGGVHDVAVVPPDGSGYKASTWSNVQYIEDTRVDHDFVLSSASGYAIAGKVTGEASGDGDGLAGATVTVFEQGTAVGSATTDASGNYSVGGVDGATYDVVVAPPAGAGYAVKAVRNVIAGSPGRGNVQVDVFMLQGAVTLALEVVDVENGEPLAGATVEACWQNDCDSGDFPPVIATGVSDASGLVTLTGMPYGAVGLRVVRDDYDTLLTVVPLNESSIQRTLQLLPVFAVSGVLSGGGSPVEGASVELYVAGTVNRAYGVTSGAGGVFSLPKVRNGVYDLVVTPPSGSRFFRTFIPGLVVHGASVTRNVTLEGVSGSAANYSVKGKVTSGFTPMPVSSVGVRIYAPGQSGSASVLPLAEAMTDSNGDFTLAVVPYGTYELQVVAPPGAGFANTIVSGVVVGSAGVTRDITLEISPADVSGGVTLFENGQPVAGASVDICVPTPDNECGSVFQQVTTDASGHFIASQVPGGVWVIRVHFGDYLDEVYGFTLSGTDVVANFALRPAFAVYGNVVCLTDAAPGAVVELLDNNANRKLRGKAVTDLNGNYRIAGVPSSNYLVSVSPSKESGQTCTAEVVNDVEVLGEDLELDLVLKEPPGQVEGDVTEADGGGGTSPVPGAGVALCPADDFECLAPEGETTTDESGHYVLPVPGGDWCLWITKPGMAPYRECFTSGAGGYYGISPVLTAVHSITGHVYAGRIGLDNVTVEIFRSGEALSFRSVVTGAGGVYNLSDLADGMYDLVFIPPPGSLYMRSVVRGVLVHAADQVQDIILVLLQSAPGGAATISGQVRDEDGSALAGLYVDFYGPNDLFTPAYSVVTGQDGSYTAQVPADSYGIVVRGQGFRQSLPSGLEATGEMTFNIVIPMVTVNGRLLNAQAAPVANASLMFLADTSGLKVLHTVYPDAAGNYSVRLPAGVDAVRVVAPSNSNTYGDEMYVIEPAFTADTTRDFTIHAGAVIQGVVRDLAGRVIANARVSIGDDVTGVMLKNLYTDASGRYKTRLAPATLRASVEDLGHLVLAESGIVLGTAGLEKNFTLPVAYLSGVVRNAAGDPVAGVTVWAERDSADGIGFGTTVTTDAQGRYSMRIPVGPVSVHLRPPLLSTVYGKTLIPEFSMTGDLAKDFVIRATVLLQGSLTDQLGTTLPGREIHLIRNGTFIAKGFTDLAGHYEIHAPTDAYDITIVFANYILDAHDSVNLTGNLTKNLTITKHDINGRIIDINGAPVGGVSVLIGAPLKGSMIKVSDNLGRFSMRMPDRDYAWCTLTPPAISGFLRADCPPLTLSADRSQLYVLLQIDERMPRFILPPRAAAVGHGSCTFTWQTDEPALSEVIVNGITYSVPGHRRIHAVPVTGLAPGTQYSAQVRGHDHAGNGPLLGTTTCTTLGVPDTRPPVYYTQPVIWARTDTYLRVFWWTNEPATTRLLYGTGSPVNEVTEPGLHYFHDVLLTNLTPDTTYVLRALASDASGNGPTASRNVTVRTTQHADYTNPVIVSGPVVSHVSDTSVTIAWHTDEPAASGVSLNDGGEYFTFRDEDDFVTEHEVTITGLSPSTQYTYVVSSSDASGNGPVLSAPAQVRTNAVADTTAPALVEAVRVVGIQSQSALVQWRTGEPSGSVVEYGLAADALTSSTALADLDTQHGIPLVDLDADTEYFLRVRSIDAAGNESASAVTSFRTRAAPDSAAPRFTAVPTVIGRTNTTVTLGWEVEEPTDFVVTWGSAAVDEFSLFGSTRNGLRQRVTLTGLQPGEDYGYAVVLTDADGNSTRYENKPDGMAMTVDQDSVFRLAMSVLGIGEAQAAAGSGGVLLNLLADTTAPSFTLAPAVSWVSSDRALLSFATDEPVSVQVAYGLTGSSDRMYASTLAPDALHALVLPGLVAGAAYEYDVVVRDVAGNTATASGQFNAAAVADTTAPVLSSISVSDREAGVVAVNLVSDEPAMHEVRFGASPTTLTRSAWSLQYDDLQSVVLTGLVNGNTYYYQVVSRDPAGNEAVSTVQSFVAGSVGAEIGDTLALTLKLDGEAVPQIVQGAEGVVVSLSPGGLPKPLSSYVIRWYLDGVYVPTLDGLLDASFLPESLTVGTHTVRAELTDLTVPNTVTLRVSQAVSVVPVPVTVTPDLSAFENVSISITRNGVEITRAPEGADNITLRVVGYDPSPGANHTFRWYLDGVYHPEFDNQLEGVVAFNPLPAGKHVIRLEMTDNAAPTLVTARSSKVVAVSKGTSGGAVGAGLVGLLLFGALRRRAATRKAA